MSWFCSSASVSSTTSAGILRQPSSPSPESATDQIIHLIRRLGWILHHRLDVLLPLSGLACLITIIHLTVPTLARSLADDLPASWVQSSSAKILQELDGKIYSASQVPQAQQENLRKQFAILISAPEGAPPYRLLFRSSRSEDNELRALPGGEIIIADDLLRKIPAQTEQLALLCHELGHLQHGDALRNAVKQQLPQLAWAAITGSRAGSIQALTNGLRNQRYTKEQAFSADHYAASMLRANNLPVPLLIRAIEQQQAETSIRFFKQRIEHLKNFD